MLTLWQETRNTIQLIKEWYLQRPQKPEHQETPREEVANGLTHALGALFGVAALVVLVITARHTGDVYKIVSTAIFGATLIILYSISSIYHFIKQPKLKKLFRILDHSAIYLLIAGTYTPFTLVTLHGAWGWSIFGVIWGLALFGILFKVFFVGKLDVISTLLYIGMGWIIVLALDKFIYSLPNGGLIWLFVGGLFYTLGTFFYLKDHMPYNHSIWHLFVLGGSVSHFIAIYGYVI